MGSMANWKTERGQHGEERGRGHSYPVTKEEGTFLPCPLCQILPRQSQSCCPALLSPGSGSKEDS